MKLINTTNIKEYIEKEGNRAEKLAYMFLMKQGYRILAINYVNKLWKVDIIATKNNTTHFIEVRGEKRSNSRNVNHETLDYYLYKKDVTYRNLLFMKHVIGEFKKNMNVSDETPIQIDLLIITFYYSREAPRIKLLEDVFNTQ